LNEKPTFEDDDPPELEKKFYSFKISCYLNKAACALKLHNWQNAADDTTIVLEMSKYLSDTDKAKALYRRGSAKVGMKDEEEAIKDLQEALKLNPQDAAIIKEITIAKQKIQAREKAQKKAFAKMFD
jgi:peptidyl-prolyl isomerase D